MKENDGPESTEKIVCVYHRASGSSFSSCVYLGQRHYENCDDPDESDFWVLGNRQKGLESTTITIFFSWKDWLTGIWRSPAGVVYVTDATVRAVHRYDDIYDLARPPVDFPLETALEGVWGLDDRNVFAWGTRKNAKGDFEWPVFRYDGQRWTTLPQPGFAVMSMHGIAPDFVYAAGFNGSVGRWDGSAWRRFSGPTAEVLNSVFVAGPDEMYACGGNGIVLEGSASGWGKIAEVPEGMPAYAVAKFKGELYVGGGPLGLYRRVGSSGELALLKPNVQATHFDARDALVITCDEAIVGTADNTTFKGTGVKYLCQNTTDKDIIQWDDHIP